MASIRVGTPHEVATEVSVNTWFGAERVVRAAYELARTRRKHLTLIHKTNVLSNAGRIWTRAMETVGAEYPDVETAYCHIDAATIYMVTDPTRFDVIVTDNLFGDIITDLAGAVTGGIGLAASGEHRCVGHEPVDVRARPRLRTRHRRPGDRRSHGSDPVGRDAAASPGP